MSFMRCLICVIFLNHATVRSQIWERTIHLYNNLYYFFIHEWTHFLCLLISSFFPMSPHFIHRIVSTLSHFLVQPFLCSFSLYSTSLPPSLTKPRSKHHAMPHEPNPHSQIVVHQHSHTNPTHHIHSNPWLDHHATLPSLPCHPPCHRNLPPLDLS